MQLVHWGGINNGTKSRGCLEEEGKKGLGDAGGDFFERRGASVAFSREKRRAREEGGGSRGRRGRVSRRQEAIARDGRGLGARIEAFAGATIARRARVEGSGARPRKQRGKKIRSRLARVGNVPPFARATGRARAPSLTLKIFSRRGAVRSPPRRHRARTPTPRIARVRSRASRARSPSPRAWSLGRRRGDGHPWSSARSRARRAFPRAPSSRRAHRTRASPSARARSPSWSLRSNPRRALRCLSQSVVHDVRLKKLTSAPFARRARADGIPGEPVVIY